MKLESTNFILRLVLGFTYGDIEHLLDRKSERGQIVQESVLGLT